MRLSFFLIITSLILIHIPGSLQQDEQYVTCSQPFHCGNIRDLRYPFFGSGRPLACGYPGFELNCNSEFPLLNISSMIYQVLQINNTTQTLRVARGDLFSNYCLPALPNTTLDFENFGYYSTANDQNLTLSYGCNIDSIPPGTTLPREFICPENGVGFYSILGDPTTPPATSITCNNTIFVPINQSLLQTLQAVTGAVPVNVLQGALANGFTIQWSANNSNCENCVQSSGVCGYDSESRSFACYCNDRPYALTCNNTIGSPNGNGSGGSTPQGMNIWLPIAGAILAGIGLGWLIFYCKQRRKQKLAAKSSLAVSKEITPPPSSEGLSTPSNTSMKTIPPSFTSSKSDFGRDTSYFGVQVFTYTELEEATDNFNASREIGEGGFGTVYYGVLSDGRIVAVKRLFENNFKRVEQFINEVEILARLRHTNLVMLFGCTSKRSRELLLVYEYIPNGTVADHLHGRRAKSGLLSWPVRLNIAIESAEALAYLHKSDIIHRDVKTNNILLDNNFHVKVADFGLSRLFPTDVTHVSTAPQGTPGYVDPEYYQCYQLTEKSDVYSFGVVLIELISSLQAVDTNRHRHDINLANMAFNKIQNHALNELVDKTIGFETNTVVRRMVTLVAELAFRCLQQERDMRPSMDEVLEGLKGIQNEDLNAHKVEILDILVDDSGLCKASLEPPSPDSIVTDTSPILSMQNSIV